MSDNLIRVSIFVFGLLLFSGLEFVAPYRKRVLSRGQRWPGNFALIAAGNLLVKALVPGGLMVFAQFAKSRGLGLFNLADFSVWVSMPISIVVLDLAIYFQHVLSHTIPLLWRFHRVHHADVDLDATSALRFHPLEIVGSIFYKALWVLALGISVEAIFLFEIILNFTAMFNHANLHIPKRLERILRRFIVTPQMHIVHHSVVKWESDTNFGFNLSIWDTIFKTYKEDFEGDDLIGQRFNRDTTGHKPVELLLLPFRNPNR